MPETSIIIRTYNEEKHLPSLFQRLAEQDYRDFETIVVDSGSVDRTREIAHKNATHVVHIRQGDFTFGYSLNEGVRKSDGRFIAIISAHALPVGSSWLRYLVDPLRNPQTAMVYGRQEGVAESKLGELFDFERIFGTRPATLQPPNFFANNANSAIRRDLWNEYAFDETLPGLEDIDWAKHWMEKKYVVMYEPCASVQHIHEESWPQVRRRYYREGQAAKWIGITGRRDVPGELAREVSYFFGDIFNAATRGNLNRLSEILRFRFEKVAGRVAGIWDGAKMENPRLRQQMLFDKTYDAVVIQSPKHAAMQKLELPELKPSEILVRVAFEGVCATDIEIFEGSLGYYRTGLAKYPIVPGHEFSGTVAAIGARVTDFAEDDRVVVECIQGCGDCDACRRENAIGCVNRTEVGVIGRNGGYAQFMISPARFAHKIPGEIGLREASLCEPLAVVLKGLRRLSKIWLNGARFRCAVVGAGPIGHLAALVLAHRGNDVTVFDLNSDRLAHFDDARIKGDHDLASNIGSYDVIVEATGNPQALETILSGSQAGATILLLGLPYARRDFNFETIVGYDKTIVGSVGSTSQDFAEALTMLPNLRTTPFFSEVFQLNEVDRAWEAARSGKHLKVVLAVNGATG